jgi:hypothetical protein
VRAPCECAAANDRRPSDLELRLALRVGDFAIRGRFSALTLMRLCPLNQDRRQYRSELCLAHAPDLAGCHAPNVVLIIATVSGGWCSGLIRGIRRGGWRERRRTGQQKIDAASGAFLLVRGITFG